MEYGEQQMKSIKEIKLALEECSEAVEDYRLSMEGGDDINRGWLEALAFVLEIDLCNCGCNIVKAPHNQCVACLDIADDEKNRHEGRHLNA